MLLSKFVSHLESLSSGEPEKTFLKGQIFALKYFHLEFKINIYNDWNLIRVRNYKFIHTLNATTVKSDKGTLSM